MGGGESEMGRGEMGGLPPTDKKKSKVNAI